MSYFDIGDIVADEERLPCTFQIDAELIGYLDSTNDDENIDKDTRIELPVWLAAVLGKRRMVTVDMPRGFGARTRQALLADAMAVSLRERSPHCFHLCTRAAELSSRVEALELPRIARVALAARAIVTLDQAANSVGSDVAATRGQLTDFEVAIFERGYDFAKDKLGWRRRKSAPLRVSVLEQGVAARRARAAALAAEAAQVDSMPPPAAAAAAAASSAFSAAASSQASTRFTDGYSVGASSEATTHIAGASRRSVGEAASTAFDQDDTAGASIRSSDDAELQDSPSKRFR